MENTQKPPLAQPLLPGGVWETLAAARPSAALEATIAKVRAAYNVDELAALVFILATPARQQQMHQQRCHYQQVRDRRVKRAIAVCERRLRVLWLPRSWAFHRAAVATLVDPTSSPSTCIQATAHAPARRQAI